MPAIILAVTMLLAAAVAPEPDSHRPADLILIDGNIHTLDPGAPHARAVAIRGDRIVLVGENEAALRLKGSSTRVVSLGGRTVVPGLTDAHGHVAGLGFSSMRLDLTGTASAAEVAKRVRERAAAVGPGRWIVGRGWDQNDWEVKSFPTHGLLDEAAPDNPVVLDRVDGHAIWVNARAMEAAGVGRESAAPAGGQILRDTAGAPTGVFVDNAENLISAAIPPPTRDDLREALRAGMNRCLAAGLTGVHDAGVSEVQLELYRELLVKEELPFRVYAMLDPEPGLLNRQFARGPEVGAGAGRLTVRAVKLYADGALGSRGAALLTPYLDDPGNTGLIRTEPEKMREIASRAAAAGYQVCVHAIGDRGNRLAIDALGGAMRATSKPDLRFRVEHAQVVSLDDIPRFSSLGIIASMQPTHATSDMYWAEDRVGPDRIRGAYAWRALLNSGARLACGSDFPVESERPLLGFYAAITRQDAKGWPEGGWRPDQRLTREEALRCFTTGAAWAGFEEESRGSITAGRLADLTVLSGDIMRVPAPEILSTSVEMTIVGGRIAFEKP